MEDSRELTNKVEAAIPIENLEQHVDALMSDDYFKQLESTFVIERHGKQVATMIIEMMLKTKSNADKINDISYMLQVIGKNAVDPILKAIESLKIEKSYDIYLLNGLLETLARIREKSAAPVVAKLIDRLNGIISESKDKFIVELCQDSKVEAHIVLGELSDKSCLEDIKKMLGDGSKHARPEIVTTLAKIGGKDVLLPIARLYSNIDKSSGYVLQTVKESFREIVKRDKVELTDPIFRPLKPAEFELINQLYPKSRNSNGSGNGNGHHSNGTNGKEKTNGHSKH